MADNLPEKVFEKMFENDNCSKWMGVELVEISHGYCKIAMTVKKDMLNGFGILHGGIAYAFADSAFAFASNSGGQVSVSIHGSMNFSKSAKEGDKLLAEAKVLNDGRKTAEYDCTVFHEESNKPYYFFRGTVYRKEMDVLKM